MSKQIWFYGNVAAALDGWLAWEGTFNAYHAAHAGSYPPIYYMQAFLFYLPEEDPRRIKFMGNVEHLKRGIRPPAAYTTGLPKWLRHRIDPDNTPDWTPPPEVPAPEHGNESALQRCARLSWDYVRPVAFAREHLTIGTLSR